MKATSAIEPPVRPQPLRKSLLIGLYRRDQSPVQTQKVVGDSHHAQIWGYGGVTVTLYETPSCATEFLHLEVTVTLYEIPVLCD
jgi:hypothetical protein